MNRRCIPVLAALLAASLSAFAAEPDGRPVVLILGDNNASPHGSSPGWPALIAKANPTWDVRSISDPKQTITSLAANIDTTLAAQPPLSSVILFLGTQDAAAENYAKADAKAVGESMSKIIKAIKANPNSKSATITLSTAMPVINARLDQWSKDKYKDSEQNSDAIAEALRAVAAAENVPLLDTHKWAKDDAQDGKAGRLLGSIGWQVRDWGMPAIAAHVGDHLKKNEPKPLDAAKFANWQKEFAANQQLETILASTSEGLVSATGEYPGKLVPEKFAYYIIELPPELITGQTLNVLFKAGDKPHAAIGNAGNRPFAQTTLIVTAGDAEAKIPLKAADWQTIDEATPDKAVDASRYRFNMQKMNYFGIASSEAGSRRWVLARFDISALAGKKITAAKFNIGAASGMEVFEAPDKVTPFPHDKIGNPVASIITGQDTQWDDAAATWRTRDGKLGWSGGKIDTAKRIAALKEFLATNPPATVAKKAQAALAETK